MERSDVDLADVLGFIRVVETGGFARAAQRLGTSKSILSRRVARLESALGARLLTRTAKGAQPTAVGQTYYARAVGALGQLEAAHEAVSLAVSEIAGPIRLTASLSFGTAYLSCALAEFMTLHPRVELDVSLDDRTVDLTGGGYDLGIRLGALPDSALVARKLAPVRRVVVGAPSYLDRRGRPQTPQDLSDHELLIYGNVPSTEQWRFRAPDGGWITPRISNRLRSDSGEMLRQAAEAGQGLVILPTFLASPGLHAGTLEVVLADHPFEEGGLYAVMPPGGAGTARVRALVDFLAARFGPEPSWDPCWLARQSEDPKACGAPVKRRLEPA